MATRKFTINKRTLLEAQNDAFYLTRVPNSNMQLYMVLDRQKDIVAEDQDTITAELDEGLEREIVKSEKGQAPKLEDVLLGKYNDRVSMTPEMLEEDYYAYEPSRDPEVRRHQNQERAKRQEAASRKYQEGQQQGKHKETVKEKADSKQNTVDPRKGQERAEVKQQYYNKEQFQQIKLGVKRGLDVSLYANIAFNSDQMKELRLALKQGVDIRKYNNPVISAAHMRELRLGAENGVELSLNKLDQTRYNAGQIHELRVGFEKGLNVNAYLNPAYTADQMKEIRLGEQIGLDTTAYQSLHYTANQMKTMRLQLILQRIKEVIKNLLQHIRDSITHAASRGADYAVEHMKASMQERQSQGKEEIVHNRLQDAVAEIKADLINSELIEEEAYDDQMFEDIITRHVKSILNEYETKDINMDQAATHAAKDIMKEAGTDMDQMEDKVLYAKSTEEAVREVLEQQEEMVVEEIQMEM